MNNLKPVRKAVFPVAGLGTRDTERQAGRGLAAQHHPVQHGGGHHVTTDIRREHGGRAALHLEHA